MPVTRSFFNQKAAPAEPQHLIHVVKEPPTDPKEIGVQKIDFNSLGLPEYTHKYALVLDNVFSPEDCKKLYACTGGSLADYSGNWEVALLNAGGDKQYLDTRYRNSGRIMVDTHETADWILQKIYPYLGEIHLLENASRHSIPKKEQKTAKAKLVRLNERLRFLKYQLGSFFMRHCDGLYYTPDQKQVSYYTLQIYLNGEAESLEGGATRIFCRKDSWALGLDDPLKGPCIDIPPRLGRVLVFEQDNVLHSGEPITKGVKISMRTDFMYEITYEE